MFCKILRDTRMKRKITQQKMADTVEVSLRTYQKYEQGVREPDFATLVKLADILEVPTDYLLSRDLSVLKSFDGFQ